MFNFFTSSQKSKVVGLEFLPSGVAIVETFRSGKKSGEITQHAFIESVGQQAQVEALNAWVKSNNAEKEMCHCLVMPDDYNLLQIEKPSVGEDEIEEAIKWKIKDLITFDIENVVMECFSMPDSPKSNTQQLNVIAANENVLSAYVGIVRDAGLNMSVMDVNELALKNILKYAECENGTFAVLVLNEYMGQVYVFKDAQLYVVRDFKTGINQLLNEEGQEAVFDAIVLEIQRSVDYFESYYGLGGISKLLISPQIQATEKMANYLQNYVSFEMDFITVNKASDKNEQLEFDHRCFMAYCASLRG